MLIKNKEHQERVERIQKSLSLFYKNKQKVRVYHGSSNSTRQTNHTSSDHVDVSDFVNILEINEEEQYVIAEPNISMGVLVSKLSLAGFLPLVVPEFSKITIGGAVQGGGEESSSFKYGLFHDTCVSYELILGNGERVVASREENKELFDGVHCSYGSLAVVTAIQFKIIPYQKFIKVSYIPVHSLEEIVSQIDIFSKKSIDFLDGIMFSKSHGVIITGEFTDVLVGNVVSFSRAIDEWFYIHAEQVSKKDTPHIESMSPEEYFFRYDRGAFWMGSHAFKLTNVPFNRVTRFLCNPFCSTAMLYKFLNVSGHSQDYFIQDVNVPKNFAYDCLQKNDLELEAYPVWICPIKPGKDDKLASNTLNTDLVYNIGLWGKCKLPYDQFVKFNQSWEDYLEKIGGRKMLYAHSYYTEDAFWRTYDKEAYLRLRMISHAEEVFDTIWSKTRVQKEYAKRSVFFTLLKVLFSVGNS